MEVKVESCNKCPFKVLDYDGNCLGDDTLLYCNLKRYLGFKNSILISYNSIDTEEPTIKIPESCPIKYVDIKISNNG